MEPHRRTGRWREIGDLLGQLPEHASTDPHELAAEIAAMLRSGVTIQALRDQLRLLALMIVAAKAATGSPADHAVAAEGLIREAAARVDSGTGGAVSVLLGLAPGTRGSLLKDRREKAARLLHVNVDHFRKVREEPLIEAVANEVCGADSAWRLRQRHRSEPERQPVDSRLAINWLERHQAYRRVWTPIAALRDDLVVLLDFIRDNAEWPDVADRLMNQLWRYAQFSRELERFTEDYGGLWLLADIDSEVAAADDIRRIGFYVPLGEADSSWLRLVLGDTPELDQFIDRMLAEQRGKEMMAVWLDWAKTCTCPPDSPQPDKCNVHRWMAACDEFIRLIDRDWYRVADHYRASDADIHGIDVRELWDSTP